MSRWDFLNTFNSTAGKSWSVMWLWIYTGLIWGIVALVVKTPPTEWLVGWMGGLTLYSGVSAYQYGTMRNTDYGALERKAGMPATTNQTVNVQAQQANVTGKTEPPAP